MQSKDPDVSMTALVQQAGEALPFPRICTVRTLLRNFLELRTVSREFVRLASGFVTVPKEHELLEMLSSTDGAAAFRRHFTLEKGGVLKILELAPSLRIPFEVLINITPLIKPRFHLIATSPVQSAGEFEIVVPVGDYDDTDGLVLSNWQYLFTRPISHEHLKETNVFTPATPLLRGFFSESAFSTPSDRSAPMLMIAEGVGIVLSERCSCSGSSKLIGFPPSPHCYRGSRRTTTHMPRIWFFSDARTKTRCCSSPSSWI